MTWAPLALSLQIATIATIVAVVLGTVLALALGSPKLPGRHLLDAIVSAPLVLPPTVLGYYLLVSLGPDSAVGRAWESVFGEPIAFTFTGAVIAATVGSLPLVVRAIRVGLDAVDGKLVAAARTLGAAPGRVLMTITLPLAAPGIVAGAMLGFARSLGDYGITMMVAGSRVDGVGIHDASTASIYVYGEYITPHHEHNAFTMAIAMTVVGVLLLYLANRMTRRLHRRG